MSMLDKLLGRKETPAERAAKETATEIKAVDVEASGFAQVYLAKIYTQIMHECADRTSLPEDVKKAPYTMTVHDSFSPQKRGLVSLLVEGMTKRTHKYYEPNKTTLGDYVFKEVPANEAVNEKGEVRPRILELDFREFLESKVLGMIFDILGGVMQSTANGVTISRAVLLGIHELSGMTANDQNIEPLTRQLRQLNDSISQGRPGVIDAKSKLEFPKFDPKPAAEASTQLFNLISSLTGLPASYIFGEVAGGLGDTSKSDERRFDAAIRRYYHSIYAPAVFVVFQKPFEYKPIIIDADSLIKLLTWVENTRLLTPDGKRRIVMDNTSLTENDFTTLPIKPEEPKDVNQQN